MSLSSRQDDKDRSSRKVWYSSPLQRLDIAFGPVRVEVGDKGV